MSYYGKNQRVLARVDTSGPRSIWAPGVVLEHTLAVEHRSEPYEVRLDEAHQGAKTIRLSIRSIVDDNPRNRGSREVIG